MQEQSFGVDVIHGVFPGKVAVAAFVSNHSVDRLSPLCIKYTSSFKLSNAAYTNDSKETNSIYSDEIPMKIAITDSSFDV